MEEAAFAPAIAAADMVMIDLMVLYTDQARRAAGGGTGIEVLIDLAISEANQVLANSRVNARFNLVHHGKIDYTESGDIALDVQRLKGRSDGHLDGVHALRSAYKADFVMLMVETERNGFAGIASEIPSPPTRLTSDAAFSVFRRSALGSSTYLVVHELGHLLGCAHDRLTHPSSPSAFTYSRGHRFVAGNVTYTDVMSYAPGIQLPFFSNPEVQFHGTPTGVPEGETESADNAKTINRTAVTVAGYQEAVCRFELAANELSISESGGVLNTMVVRTGNIDTTALVAYSTLDGSALASVDYEARSGTLLFQPGEASLSISIPLINDSVPEPDEAFSILLQTPNPGSALGFLNSASITIQDDEAAVSLSADEFFVTENGGAATITIRRHGDLSQVLEVAYAALSEGAQAGSDFTPVTGRVSFAAGERERTVLAPVLNDSTPEPDEAFLFVISPGGSPSAIVSPSQALVRILDDDRSGSVVVSFPPSESGARRVGAIALLPDGRMICGGRFTNNAGIRLAGIVRLEADGRFDPTFKPAEISITSVPEPGLFPGSVGRIVLQDDGKILFGGEFAFVNGEPRNHLARLHSDGALDTEFNPVPGPNGSVADLAITEDGRIVIGGDFKLVNGSPRNFVARLNENGSLDETFAPIPGPDLYGVWSLALQPDGKLVIGGFFSTVDGVARNNVARLRTDGTVDVRFGTESGVDSVVTTLILLPDGKVLIGGLFNRVNGVARPKIARLDSNGRLDSSFLPPAFDAEVLDLAVLPDGRVLVGGAFRNPDGLQSSFLVRLHADGRLDRSFDPGAGPGDYIFLLAPQADGWLNVGGIFSSFNGIPKTRFARLKVDGTNPFFESPLRMPGGPVRYPARGLPGTTFTLEQSLDLKNWTGLGPLFFRSHQPVQIEEPSNQPQQFLRLRQADRADE
jgi:uncharacterized delta-60 repeat protein